MSIWPSQIGRRTSTSLLMKTSVHSNYLLAIKILSVRHSLGWSPRHHFVYYEIWLKRSNVIIKQILFYYRLKARIKRNGSLQHWRPSCFILWRGFILRFSLFKIQERMCKRNKPPVHKDGCSWREFHQTVRNRPALSQWYFK